MLLDTGGWAKGLLLSIQKAHSLGNFDLSEITFFPETIVCVQLCDNVHWSLKHSFYLPLRLRGHPALVFNRFCNRSSFAQIIFSLKMIFQNTLLAVLYSDSNFCPNSCQICSLDCFTVAYLVLVKQSRKADKDMSWSHRVVKRAGTSVWKKFQARIYTHTLPHLRRKFTFFTRMTNMYTRRMLKTSRREQSAT